MIRNVYLHSLIVYAVIYDLNYVVVDRLFVCHLEWLLHISEAGGYYRCFEPQRTAMDGNAAFSLETLVSGALILTISRIGKSNSLHDLARSPTSQL